MFLRTHLLKQSPKFKSGKNQFSTQIDKRETGLTKFIFPTQKKFYPPQEGIEIHKRLNHEYTNNSLAHRIMVSTEKYLKDATFQINQSTSFAQDEENYLKNSAVFFYENETSTVHLPSSIHSPYKIMRELNSSKHNFHKSPESYFVGSTLHELTHAISSQLGLETTKKDKRLIALDEWVSSGTDFEWYEKDVLKQLCLALRNDTANLDKLARAGDTDAKQLLYFIRLIDDTYPKTQFIDEMQAFLVQLTVDGAFGEKLIQRYMPQTCQWFCSNYIPRPEVDEKHKVVSTLKP